MSYKTIKDVDVAGKRVLLRVEFNVKVKNKKIEDDTRIKSSLPTINYLLEKNAKLILLAHLGRPQEELKAGNPFEEVKKKNTFAPVASYLSKLLNKEVKMAPDCNGPEVEKLVSGMQDGDVTLLENFRLRKEEEANDPKFSKSVANLGDIYIFDGFGASHRAHASVVGVPLAMLKQNKPVAAGFLMHKELELWNEARKKQGHKLLVIGGKKLKEKVKAINKLYKAVDSVLIGGAVYNIVMAGKGIAVGDSLITEKDKDYTENGKELAEKANNIILAERAVIAKKDDFSDIKKISINNGVPAGYLIADVVIDEKIKAKIKKAEVIIWFGNIGISDKEVNGKFPFAKGTEDFKNAVAPDAYVIVGGGESVAAAKGLKNLVVSTGGGASIALYTKGTLDALEALKGNTAYFKK